MPRAFLFSDLHTSNKNLHKMYDFVIQDSEIKCIICAGDIVNMGEPVWFMEKFIKLIEELRTPLFWVPGNNDFGRAYYKLNAKRKSLEGRVVKFPLLEKERLGEVKIDEILSQVQDDKPLIRRFTGVGGSPVSWSGQYEGEEMTDKKKIGGSIFVSHFPPPTLVNLKQIDQAKSKLEALNLKQIENSNKKNSKDVSDFGFPPRLAEGETGRISDLPAKRLADAPLVHICGHYHTRARKPFFGTGYLGQTKIIKLASLETGYYAIMDLENLKVEFHRFNP